MYFTSHEVLTMDENLTSNEHQITVPECNMSYDELIMYMDAPYDDNLDIPWLTSFQIRSQSQMKSKKKRTFGFQDNNHTFSWKPCIVELTNINKLQTTTSLKRQNTDDCSKTVESRISEDANEIKKAKQNAAGIEKPKKKRIRKPTLYCWDCHSIIKRKTQYCCVQCHRLYHKLCFKTNDLICLDCDMLMRMEYEDPETLALILKNTMDNVLKSESVS